MSDTPAQTAERPPKRRRLRRWLLLILFVVVLLIGGPIGYVLLRNHILALELQTTIDELDKTDPGWRLEEIEAARPPLPDYKNGALQVLAAHRLMPEGWETELEFAYDNNPHDLPPPVRLNKEQVEKLRKALATVKDALIAARKIREYSTGRYKIDWTDDHLNTPLADVLSTNQLAQLLQNDVLLLAEQQKMQQAWQSVEAIHRTGTTIGNVDGLLILLARLAIRNRTIQSVERLLGQGEVKPNALDRMQKLLQDDLREPILWTGVRGERAGLHKMFEHFKKRGISREYLQGFSGGNSNGKSTKPSKTLLSQIEPVFYAGMVSAGHKYGLEFMTQSVAAAKLPHPRRRKRFHYLDEKLKSEKARMVMPRFGLLIPVVHNVAYARTETATECAIVGLACERFRLKYKRWPNDLNELVTKKLISTVPLVPHTQKPLLYKRMENGIVVISPVESYYSRYVGYDGQLLKNFRYGDLLRANEDFAFHLWNPERRRQPPLPAGFRDFYQKEIWTAGKDGYHAYGVPALIITKNGTTLAFCESRKRKDDKATDLLVKRSTDGGFNWSEHKIVSLGDNGSAFGNPCPVLDENTGIVWLPFTRNGRDVFVTHSKDEGVTWIKPVNITDSVSKKNWVSYVTGPGAGIQIRRGANSGGLLFPCHHQTASGHSHAHVIYSGDAGKTWKLGGGLPKNTGECQVVQKVDRSLMMSVRCLAGNQNKNAVKSYRRALAISNDGGETWGKLKFDEKLNDSNCPVSFIRHSWPDETSHPDELDGILVFASPANGDKGKDLTIRLSDGDELKWVASRILNGGPSGISSLVRFKDRTVGCLYESGDGSKRKIRFARFTLDWVRRTPER